MATTRDIATPYSAKLDTMAAFIKAFLQSTQDEKVIAKTHKGISDFCYRNSEDFKKSFLNKIGLNNIQEREWPSAKEDTLEPFVNSLKKINGECVFLLKDTYEVMKQYEAATEKGFGMLINRSFLSRDNNEEDYFVLVQMVYEAISKCTNVNELLEKYVEGFNNLLHQFPHFEEKAQEIAEYVSNHTQEKRVVFVDMGFQFTFSLFCCAAMSKYAPQIGADYFSFSTYPWLQSFFKPKYFSDQSEAVLSLELKAIETFKKELRDKASGAIVGFAIGDALGFPVAGIDKTDVEKVFPSGITTFAQNTAHPFFSHLKLNQFTDNTNLLMISAGHLINRDGYDLEQYTQDLIMWGKHVLAKKENERWAGPTTLEAVKKLINGSTYNDAGSKTTSSCAATYRIVPFGTFYRPFMTKNKPKLKEDLATIAGITHNSDISKTGTVITALIISDLVSGVLPKNAIASAIEEIKPSEENKILIDRIREAVDYSSSKPIEFARKHFGTGSPIYQTLPLAIFIFLKYRSDFRAAVLAAANSYRDDTVEEKERLKGLSWQEQLQQAKGGNTDGIAALVGAFTGAYRGLNVIPKDLLSVENYQKLKELGDKLVA